MKAWKPLSSRVNFANPQKFYAGSVLFRDAAFCPTRLFYLLPRFTFREYPCFQHFASPSSSTKKKGDCFVVHKREEWHRDMYRLINNEEKVGSALRNKESLCWTWISISVLPVVSLVQKETCKFFLVNSLNFSMLFPHRVHYEEHLQARLFAVWKENTKKAVVAHNMTSWVKNYFKQCIT